MASPSMTHNASGNALASTNIAASGSVSFTVNASTVFSVQLQIAITYTTVSSTSGVNVFVYRQIGTTPTTDNQAIAGYTIPSTASATNTASIELPTGIYTITLTNLDATNAVTALATADTVTAVS